MLEVGSLASAWTAGLRVLYRGLLGLLHDRDPGRVLLATGGNRH